MYSYTEINVSDFTLGTQKTGRGAKEVKEERFWRANSREKETPQSKASTVNQSMSLF